MLLRLSRVVRPQYSVFTLRSLESPASTTLHRLQDFPDGTVSRRGLNFPCAARQPVTAEGSCRTIGCFSLQVFP